MKKIIILMLLFSSPLFAKTIGVSLSKYTSKSHEFVYSPTNTSYKISELIWKINDANMLGINASFDLQKEMTIDIEYKTKISAEDNSMQDFDWLQVGKEWTHFSNHPNTKLVSANILDMVIVKLMKAQNFDWKIRAGIKNESRKFESYDGTYIYSTGSEFRNSRGEFSGLGITYSEDFTSIYGAIEINKEVQKWNFLGQLSFSPFYTAKSSDRHHFRNFVNNNKFEGIDNGTMFGLKLGINYKVAKNYNLGISFEEIEYSQAKGITTRNYDDITSANRDNFTKLSTSYAGAGISNKYSMINIYLKYNF